MSLLRFKDNIDNYNFLIKIYILNKCTQIKNNELSIGE